MNTKEALEVVSDQSSHRKSLWLEFYSVAFQQGTKSGDGDKKTYEPGGKAEMSLVIREVNNVLKDDGNPQTRTDTNVELDEIYTKSGKSLGYSYYYLDYNRQELVRTLRTAKNDYLKKWIEGWIRNDVVTQKTVDRIPQIYNRYLCDLCERIANEGRSPSSLKDQLRSDLEEGSDSQFGENKEEKIKKTQEHLAAYTDGGQDKNSKSQNDNGVDQEKIDKATREGVKKLSEFIDNQSANRRYNTVMSTETKIISKSFRQDRKRMLESKLIKDLKNKQDRSYIKSKLTELKNRFNEIVKTAKEEGTKIAVETIIKMVGKALAKSLPKSKEVIIETLKDLDKQDAVVVVKGVARALIGTILTIL